MIPFMIVDTTFWPLTTICNKLFEPRQAFSWLPESSYLKDVNGKYCVGYATATPFWNHWGSTFTFGISTQQAEIYALAQTCPLAKAKATNIYTDS